MQRYLLVAAAVAVLAVAAFHRPAAPAQTAAALAAPSPPAVRLPRSALADEVVYVAGAVARPGIYRLASGARVSDAVARAGGLRSDADSVAVNLAARIADGDEVAVPLLGGGGTCTSARSAGSRRRTRKKKPAPPAAAPIARVDVNTADASLLASVPGIGPVLSERIVTYREANGTFSSLDELLDVNGMTASKLDRIAAYLVLQ